MDELYLKIQNNEVSMEEAVKEINRLKECTSLSSGLKEDMQLIVADLLEVSADEVVFDIPFSELGLEPMKLSNMINILNEKYSLDLKQDIIVKQNDLNSMAEFIIKEHSVILQSYYFMEEEKQENQEIRGASKELLVEQTKNYLKKIISFTLKLSIQEIDDDLDLEHYGIDSIMILLLMDKLEKDFISLQKTLFFEYKNINELTAYFIENKKEELVKVLRLDESYHKKNKSHYKTDVVIMDNVKADKIKTDSVMNKANKVSEDAGRTMDIAVIGLAGTYADANNIEEFFDNLASGKDSITEIPSKRWNHSRYFSADKNEPNKTYGKWGSFIKDVDKFDSLFFHISPREADKMDPQERLFLECVYKALEDAGYTRDTLTSTTKYGHGARVGVFVGAMFEEYQFFGIEEQVKKNVITLNGSKSSLANRISYYFNFQGPSISVDTMCSSSLTSVYLACQSIQKGDCEAAIAGGVNLSIHPNKYIALGEDKFLSSVGRCQSYGEGGDGYVPGEGVGAILLKPLENAIKDGAHIYGIIKGAAINHGGKTNGYSVPNPSAMVDLIQAALNNANINPRTVSYIEGHGTGTFLGDPIEIAGLTKAYSEYTKDTQFCAIGSVKSNIGHCEGAAGIASLTKVLLQMKYKKLVPSLHSQTLNSNINFFETPFVVQKQLEDWKRPILQEGTELIEYPRRAGISSFGAGGSNAHLILEEYTPVNEERETDTSIPNIIVLSARTREQLRSKAEDLVAFLRKHTFSTEEFYHIGYTLQVGREAMEERMAFCCNTCEKMQDILNAFIRGEESEEYYTGHINKNKEFLSLIAADEEIKRCIENWLLNEKYKILLKVWVNGATIDWNIMYDNKKPKKISLPAYPFERASHWFTGNAKRESEQILLQFQNNLHPLVQQNNSDLFEQRYRSTFTGEEFFLIGHKIQGEKTFPAAAYLEMIREAVRQACGNESENQEEICLKNIVWQAPFIVAQNPINLNINICLKEQDELHCEVYSIQEERRFLHSMAEAKFVAKSSGKRLDLAAIMKRCKERIIEAQDIYHRFQTFGISYGSSHKGIQRIYKGEREVLAQLSLHENKKENSLFYLHPGILDSAIQATIGFLFDKEGMEFSLPFALNSLEIFNKTESEMWAVLRRNETINNDRLISFDIDLCKEDGEICVRFRGLTIKHEEKIKRVSSQTTILCPAYIEENSISAKQEEKFFEKLVFVCSQDEIDRSILEGSLSGYECIYFSNNTRNYEKVYQAYAVQVFEAVKRVLQEKKNGKVLFQIVVLEQELEWLYSGLFKILETAKLENPNVCAAYIQLHEESDCKKIAEVIKEETGADSKKCIVYKENKRYVQYWTKAGLFNKAEDFLWKDNGVYIITGGIGGLAKITAKHIAKKTAGTTIILVGRTSGLKLTEQMAAEYQALDAKVEYHKADVTNYMEVEGLIKTALKKYGKINGIIHGAGIIQDNYIIRKPKEQFISVLRPKTFGIVNLDLASKDCDLDFFVAYSSIAGSLGNIGQADYACANGFMDSYITYRDSLVERKERYGKSLTINWPLWKDGGMHVDEKIEKLIGSHTGIIPLPADKGMAVLEQVMPLRTKQVMIVESELGRQKETLLALKIPFYEQKEEIMADTKQDTKKRADLLEETIDFLKNIFSRTIQLSAGEIKEDTDFEQFGINSIMIIELITELENSFGELSKTLLYEYNNIKDLASYFADNHKQQLCNVLNLNILDKKVKNEDTLDPLSIKNMPVHLKNMKYKSGNSLGHIKEQKNDRMDIAVIGLAGRYPGATNINEFWKNLKAGKDCITEIPKDRWEYGYYTHTYIEGVETRYPRYNKWGGFMEGVDKFDPLFFHISPRDAQKMDPQERLFLECVYETLQDAGYTRENIASKTELGRGANVGVFVGLMYEEYQFYAIQEQKKGNPVTASGSAAAVANRVSYAFNFQGPSIALDTMCSSSLTAVYLACESLQNGVCEAAIAGGVNVSVHPNKYLALSEHNFISSNGKCNTFGEGGDGYIPGEGVGAILLKPVSKAIMDGDHIYGVVKGAAVNHGGKTHGYTVPNPNAQAEVIKRALKNADVDPQTISYVEAHGTGTSLGDPIEITGLTKVYREYTNRNQYCCIGSVKSNIGHCEGAAGIAAITKVLLQMKYEKLVPSLHSEQLNKNINFTKTPFIVQQRLETWKRPKVSIDGLEKELKRRAGISAFGAGGSNAHIILEEFKPEIEKTAHMQQENTPVILLLSAMTRGQLKTMAKSLQKEIELQEFTDDDLPSIAYTLQVGREEMDERMAFSCSTVEEMNAILKDFIEGQPNDKIFADHIKHNEEFLSVLLQDGEAEKRFEQWLAQEAYEKVLKLWVKGLSVNWFKLYKNSLTKRISLPTYPFLEESYWITSNTDRDSTRPLNVKNYIHPLVHRNTSDFMEQRYTTEFSGEEAILTNHQVNGKKLLPAAAYIEMLREAIQQALGQGDSCRKLCLSDIVWQKAYIAESTPKKINIGLSIGEGEIIHYQVYSIDDSNGERNVYSLGQANIYESDGEKIDITSIQSRCERGVLYSEKIYEAFHKCGINYTDEHKGIQVIYLGDDEVLAKLSLDSLNRDLSGYMLHPGMLDAAIQASIGLFLKPNQEAAMNLSLPFTADRVEIYQETEQEMWAFVRRMDDKSIQSFDIDLCTQTGELCVRIQGLLTKAVNTFDTRDDLVISPVWRKINDISKGSLVDMVRETAVFTVTADSIEEIRQQFGLNRVFPIKETAAIDELCRWIPTLGTIDSIIYIPDKQQIPSISCEAVIEGQQRGILPFFRLIKAFDALGYEKDKLSITVITYETVQLKDSDKCNPVNASFHGLVGTIAKEYPNWNIRIFDMEEGVKLADGIFMKQVRNEDTLFAYRKGYWYRQNLVQVQYKNKRERTSYQVNGIYVVIGGAGGIGTVFSEYLIKNYQAGIVWIGRRPMTEEIKRKIDQLSRYGTEICYISADAADKESLMEAYIEIKKRFSKINGVINSALLLEDQRISNMSEESFLRVLAAKVNICVRMVQVFEKEPLDFMLFFSSLQSFAKAFSQGNYAAGCTFKDAFAKALSKEVPYEVKIVNWGFWGNEGIVASDIYKTRMAQAGVASINAPEAMELLEYLLAHSLNQVGYLKVNSKYFYDGIIKDEVLYVSAGNVTSQMARMKNQLIKEDVFLKELQESALTKKKDMEDVLVKILWLSLKEIGLFKENKIDSLSLPQKIKKFAPYEKWIMGTIHILQEYNILSLEDTCYCLKENIKFEEDEIKKEWEKCKAQWNQIHELKPYVEILSRIKQAIVNILGGKVKATEVLFPNASMRLVEPIYKYDTAVNYTNHILATLVEQYVKERAKEDKYAKIRILEVGAGTGGTSFQIFKKLRPYEDYVMEYCYTDISKAFLSFAEKEYGTKYSYIKFKALDISKKLTEQEIEKNAYDIVIATNVIHATKNISHSLRNIKLLLKENGLCMINESTEKSMVTHMIFGLLEGWWLFEDEEIRLRDCPLLSVQNWKSALYKEGFRQVTSSEWKLGQEIIVGESDGITSGIFTRDFIISDSVTGKKKSAAFEPVKEGVYKELEKGDTDKTGIADARSKVTNYFKGVLSEALKIPVEKLDSTEQLEKYGLDSIVIMQLTRHLEKNFKSVKNSLFFECQTIDELADYFMKHELESICRVTNYTGKEGAGKQPGIVKNSIQPACRSFLEDTRNRFDKGKERGVSGKKEAEELKEIKADKEDIAVIGLAGRYPKAKDIHQFWENLKEGRDCITGIPKERWDWKDYFSPQKGKENTMYTKWGGFLEDIDKFDPYFFGIAPVETERMDPQERLFLQTAYECMEDAGYIPKHLSRNQKVGVFVGAMNGYYPTGASFWSIANRVSYLFNFHGPSLSVDTACSSSLTALHLALDSIHNGTSECAIVGGVNLIVSPKHFIRLCTMRMLSPGNTSRAFGANADGIVDGEGVGAILLKPLKKAVEDRDNIYGVIKGSMLNSGGKTNGYTVPNPAYQAKVIKECYREAGIDPRTISYIEAHGTGTALGDPIEIEALSNVFAEYTKELQFCSIGSVKSNIGHSESAAGIAAITKVLLQLKHKKLVPSLHSEEINENLAMEHTPFVVQHTLEDWEQPRLSNHSYEKVLRRAGISSFGAGGSNVHVVIEEHVPAKQERKENRKQRIVVLSAITEHQLEQKAKTLLKAINGDMLKEEDLLHISYTLLIGREEMEERLGLIINSMEELKQKLKAFLRHDQVEDTIYIGNRKKNQEVLSVISADKDMENAMEAWISKEKYKEILMLWINGVSIDWYRLFKEEVPHRISLPTYPFTQESYWIKEDVKRQCNETTEGELMHPLIHRNCSTYNKFQFTSTFSGLEFFIADHVIQGNKVLSGVTYLEMARAAIEKLFFTDTTGNGKIIGLKDVIWLKPIIVREEPVKLSINLDFNQNDEIFFEIYTGVSKKISKKTLHCKGFGMIMEAMDCMADIEDIKHRMQKQRTVKAKECYEAFEKMGIFYGASYQAIDVVYAGENEALAHIQLPDCVEDTIGQYVFHPSLADAALQGILAMSIGYNNLSQAVPYQVKNMEFIQSCQASMWVHVTCEDRMQMEDKNLQSYQISMYDEDGNLCIRMKDVDIRVAKFLFENTDKTELFEYRRVIRKVPLKTGTAKSYKNHILILCDCSMDKVKNISKEFSQDTIFCLEYKKKEQSYERYFFEMFNLIQNILLDRNRERVFIQVIIPGAEDKLMYSGWLPILRTANLEVPQITGQVLELDYGLETIDMVKQIKENRQLDSIQKFFYVGKVGHQYMLEGKRVDKLNTNPVFRDNGVYVISGGAGGLGMILAEEIAGNSINGAVILLGRSKAGFEKVKTLKNKRTNVVYMQVDITNKQAVEAAISEIKKEYGTIQGILHSAAVLKDAFIVKKTEDQFMESLAPKTAGLVNLDEATKNFKLDFFVIHSSISAVFGNIGQADYAAGNAFADEYARYRNELAANGKRFGRTISINWPLWNNGGLQIEEGIKGIIEQRTGMKALSTKVGLQCFYHALNSGESQIMILQGNKDALDKIAKGYTTMVSEKCTAVESNHIEEFTSFERDTLLEKVREGKISEEQFVTMLTKF